MEILVRIPETWVSRRVPEPVVTAWPWSIWKCGLEMKAKRIHRQCVRVIRATVTYKAGV